MKEIAVVELSKSQVPKDVSHLEAILKTKDIEGELQINNDVLYLKTADGIFEFSLYSPDASLAFSNSYGIEISGRGDIFDLVETIIDLKEIFESAFDGCVFSCEYLDEQDTPSSTLIAANDYFTDLDQLDLKTVAKITLDDTNLNTTALFKKLSAEELGEYYKIINGTLAVDTGYGDVYQFILSIQNNQSLVEIKLDSLNLEEAMLELEEAITDAFPNADFMKVV